jgi:hypothetical protein
MRLARNEEERSRLRAYVIVQGNGLADEKGLIDSAALPVEDISRALRPYAQGKGQSMAVVNLHFGNDSDGGLRTPSRAADDVLRLVFEGLGARAGFHSTSVSQSIGGPDLEKKFSAVTDKVAGRADEDETPAGDELVRVYPVRTILSLLLTDNADCVVEIRPMLEKDGDRLLSPDLRSAIVKHAAAVKLRDREKVQFSFKYRNSRIPAERIDKFHRTEVTELARELGFTTATMNFSSYADQ